MIMFYTIKGANVTYELSKKVCTNYNIQLGFL